jgi:hypothetical protein
VITVANFLLAYKGGGMPESEEEGKQVMAAWMSWMGAIGDAMVDGGNPISNSSTVAPNGTVTSGAASALTGYSVIKADSLDKAAELAKGCPILSSGGSIEVYETYNAM